jgi:glycosyltransferase involved in cell wall biosynthesis
MLTYITTCYNDEGYLDQLEDLMVYYKGDNLKLIIVDDCSDTPVDQIVRQWADDRVSLYRIEDDIGFGSHAARNLAMKQTTTEWNLLVDIDYRLVGVENIIAMIENGELEKESPHFLPVAHSYAGDNTPGRASINDFLLTKKLYWRAKGYDPEYYGFHHGDRQFIERMMTAYPNSTHSLLYDVYLEALRSPYVKTLVDSSITDPRQERYSSDHTTLYVSPLTTHTLNNEKIKCFERHASNAPIEYLPFKWIKQI